MKIKFCGAAEEVTGSKHLLNINGLKILLDCGLRQSSPEENLIYNREFLFDPKEIDVLLLSHAHLDHCGNIPTLVNQGFKGDIYATVATMELSKLIVLDAAKIQKNDVDYIYNNFGTILKPLYVETDIDKAWDYFVPIKYREVIQLSPDIKATFFDAGHILGSAQILLEFKDHSDGKNKKLLFTGDFGRKNLPILNDPELIEEANFVISESTYGNSVHSDITNAYQDLVWIINDVYQRGGKILIPAFAMERTQELVYILHSLILAKKIPEMPIFVDGPLAFGVTEIYEKHHELFDEASDKAYFSQNRNPLQAPYIKYVETVEESKEINAVKQSCIILAGSGMLSGGRMLHHLRHNLDNPKNLVLVVGYMVHDSLGRNLLENKGTVRILGEEVEVRSQLEILDSLSGHGDKLDLLNYLSNIKKLEKIFLVHGDEDEMLGLQRNLEIFTENVKIHIPRLGEEIII